MPRYVHVQSVLPQEDVIALKAKTGESSVKEAISKAVYFYLTTDPDDISKFPVKKTKTKKEKGSNRRRGKN